MPTTPSLHPDVRIGHVGVLGFELAQRDGQQAAFVAAGGYHHHIGLNTWRAWAVPRRRMAPPDSTISQSCMRTALSSPAHCGA